MKLEKIEVKNFKGLGSKTIEPQKINILVGNNGKGKTSTLEAIRYLSTGQFPDECIKKGETEMSVSGIVGTDEVKRGRRKKTVNEAGDGEGLFWLNGRKTTVKSYNEYIDKTTASNINTVELITSKELMDMDVDKLTNYLLTTVPTAIDFDKLVTLCPGVTKEMIDEMSIILPEKGITLEGLKEADAFFTASRKQLKQMCDAKKKTSEFVGVIPTRTKEAVNEELEKVIGLEASYKASLEAKNNYEKVKKAIDIQKNQLEDYKAEATLLKCSAPNTIEKENVSKNILLYRNTINELTSNSSVLENSKEMFETTLTNLSKNTCPLSDKLVCKTDKTEIKEELESSVKEINEQLEKNKRNIEQLKSKLEAAEKEQQDFILLERKYDKYISTLKTIDTLEKNIPALPNKPVDIEENKENLTALKQNLQEQLKVINLYEKTQEELKQYNSLVKQRDVYESLCKLFDEKSGIREKILSFALTPFEDYINKRAKSLHMDFEIQILVSSGVRIMCKPISCSEFIPYKNASMGEQVQVAFLIMDMLNALSNVGILIMDNLDKLDENALKKVMNLITSKEVLDTYDHIFVAMVDHSDAMDIVNTLPSGTNVIKF